MLIRAWRPLGEAKLSRGCRVLRTQDFRTPAQSPLARAQTARQSNFRFDLDWATHVLHVFPHFLAHQAAGFLTERHIVLSCTPSSRLDASKVGVERRKREMKLLRPNFDVRKPSHLKKRPEVSFVPKRVEPPIFGCLRRDMPTYRKMKTAEH